MSLDENRGQSPYDSTRRNRDSIRVNTWNEAYSGSSSKRCDICLEKWKMEIRDTPSGKCYVCVRGCGKSIPIESTTNSQSNSNAKYQNKYGSASGSNKSFITSKGKKKRRGLDPNEPTDEDKKDLQDAGLGGANWKDYFPT